MPPTRDVVVMMAFGSDVELRRNILEYQRVRHIVEKRVAVLERGSDERLNYRTQVFDVRAGRIEEQALKALLRTDIVVGIITEKNLNVIYELALRNFLRGEWILLVEGDETEKALPLYIKDLARIRVDTGGGKTVGKWADHTAEDRQDIFQFNLPLPAEIQGELEKTIAKNDGALESQLQSALNAIEHHRVPRPEFPKYVDDLDLGEILSNWTTAYPYCLWRVRWKAKPRGQSYTRDLLLGKPTLFGANVYFAQMILKTGERRFPPDPDGDDALTVEDVYEALEPYVEPDAFKALRDDIAQLAENLMKKPKEIAYQTTRVRTPIRFHGHPDRTFDGKAVLVCPVAVRIFGEPTQQHVSYLLVVFVEMEHWRPPVAPPAPAGAAAN